VKTAIFGTDANWGRIICAVGYSGKMIDPLKVTVKIGPITVVENGLPQAFSEELAKEYLQNEHINIMVDLQEGEESAIAWGCDLTYDYVRINASYRT
jgi:glutamate N-acetyltransferase/amino-acid N-acetyltransferase